MVEQADSVTLLLAATTTFRHADTKAACLDTLSMVDKCSYDDLRKRHVEDYRILFDRVSFTLGEQDASDTQTLPTDERLERLRQGQHDLQLVSLYFQFARYLLIASSRPGTLPANLQGIWNEHFLPPWDSKYTININAQMNYWPAEVCNLPECHEPLFDLIERMREPGRHTAEVMYGCRGFTAHHNTDVWGDTAPQDSYLPASYWPLGVAWLCLHLWGHYAFSLDRDFLGKVYPTLKEAVLFFVDYLVEEPGGALVTCPSVSPENTYILPGGESGVLCFGSTMDTQIVRALFTACVEAVEILGVDSVFSAELKSMQQRLPATKVGKHGQIQEWFDDAGGITTPELVAAVSNAGGLGTLGAGYLTPEKLRTAIHSVKQLTDRPFGVNLFAPQEISFSTDEVQNMNQHLDQIRVHLGIEQGPPVETYAESFDDQIQVVLEEHVPVFSFTFGIPSGNVLRQLKDQGTVVIGTATTVNEALQLEVAGVDAIVVQGSEAGGHRGTFLTDANQALIGTMALIPQVVDQVTLPVIASGGIMDGRGMIASLALGASAVQMGTAFVTCAESGAHKLYKESILTNEEDATEVTFVYSGRAARGIRTKFMQWMNDYNGDIPPYPVQNALTRDIRNAAATQNNPEYMSLWAGQGLRLATSRTADAIIDDCVREALGILGKISSLDKV